MTRAPSRTWRAGGRTPPAERAGPPQQRRGRAGAPPGPRLPSPPTSTWRTSSAATRPPMPRPRPSGKPMRTSPGCSAPAPATSPWCRTRPSPLPRRSAPSTSAPAMSSSPAAPTTPPTRSCTSRSPAVAASSRPGARSPEGGVDPEAVRAPGARAAAPRWWRSPGSPPTPAWCSRSRPSGGSAARPRCPTWWTPARRWARCPIDVERLRLRLPGRHRAQVPPGPPRASAFSMCPTGCSPPAPIRCWWTCTAPPGPTADAFELTPDARRFETWEFAHALVLGLGAAARYALEVGLETARDRARELAAYARARLADGARGPGARPRPRALRHRHRRSGGTGHDGDQARASRARGINTSSPEPGGCGDRHGRERRRSALRISPHYYNTEEEIDTAVEALRGRVVILSRWILRFAQDDNVPSFTPFPSFTSFPFSTGPSTRHTVSAITPLPLRGRMDPVGLVQAAQSRRRPRAETAPAARHSLLASSGNTA